MVARKAARESNAGATLPAVETQTAESSVAAFAIIAIGASAGGLEAFEQFFRKTPGNTGMAFVLVQHLDPGHASILTVILQRSTDMQVYEVQDQMPVAPNCVYVIPPNREMTIVHGVLHLAVPDVPRGHRMPIDTFLCSLAEDQHERSIGIILSGTGTDGTIGLHAIQQAGGITFVQEPAMARYSGMPASAIHSGCATHVAPAEKIPEALLKEVRARSVRHAESSSLQGMRSILRQLRTVTGHDFSQYKKSTIGRRIARRMSHHNIKSVGLYARYLTDHPAEVQSLFSELLIHVTRFFRDPEAFAALKADALPALFEGRSAGDVFRAWIPGCATGEEAYSIAILLREFLEENGLNCRTQIYCTDVDEDAIVRARTGTYPANIAESVLPVRLRRFFLKMETGFRVKREIREMLVFATQDIIRDPPFTRLDLISCRNLMIYLEPELQKLIIPTFHHALKPGGALFLSPSECIGNQGELFTPISRKWKIYRAVASPAISRAALPEGVTGSAELGVRMQQHAVKREREADFARRITCLQLHEAASASVITDLSGNILYVQGDAGRYLRPPPGHATLNAIEMAPEDLQFALRGAIHSAAAQNAATLEREISVRTGGELRHVVFSVRPIPGSEEDGGMLLASFKDASRTATHRPRSRKHPPTSIEARHIEELERDLTATRQNLQSIISEQRVSNKDLQSTNEEMQSTNEELQSTNEELETSREELESVNEELQILNAELQVRIDQLAEVQNDVKNLLDSTNVGIVFLDEKLIIRRFTREAVKIYRLIPTDVGRPLRDIKSDLDGEDLLPIALTVIDTLVPWEREMRITSGASYLVRIQPYRTLDDIVEGVILTFTDVSRSVEAESATREAAKLAEAVVDTVREPLIVLDPSLNVVGASRSFYHLFQVTPAETIGCLIYELDGRQWDRPALRDCLDKVISRNASFENYEVDYEFPGAGRRRMLLNARRIVRDEGDPPLILLALDVAVSELGAAGSEGI